MKFTIAKNLICVIMILGSNIVYSQNGSLLDFVGKWERYEKVYPNGKIEQFSYRADEIIMVIKLAPSSGTWLVCDQFINGEAKFENWAFWINPYTNGMCIAKEHNNFSPGDDWKFYYDDRGLKGFAAKGYVGTQTVWVRYRRID